MHTVEGISKLIDFDLAGSVGEEYPATHNPLPQERHPDAQPESKRQIYHDIYALIKIIIRQVNLTDKQKSYLKRCLFFI